MKLTNQTKTIQTSAVDSELNKLSPLQISLLLKMYKLDFILFGYEMSKYQRLLINKMVEIKNDF